MMDYAGRWRNKKEEEHWEVYIPHEWSIVSDYYLAKQLWSLCTISLKTYVAMEVPHYDCSHYIDCLRCIIYTTHIHDLPFTFSGLSSIRFRLLPDLL
jgi:hypothetical protein